MTDAPTTMFDGIDSEAREDVDREIFSLIDEVTALEDNPDMGFSAEHSAEALTLLQRLSSVVNPDADGTSLQTISVSSDVLEEVERNILGYLDDVNRELIENDNVDELMDQRKDAAEATLDCLSSVHVHTPSPDQSAETPEIAA